MFDSENGGMQITDADPAEDKKLYKLLHRTIMKVTIDIENLRFNTAISALMTLGNKMKSRMSVSRANAESFILMISPFVPHIAEEIWRRLGHTETIVFENWPEYNELLAKEDLTTIAVQVNGKLRGELHRPAQPHLQGHWQARPCSSPRTDGAAADGASRSQPQ